MKDQTPAFEAPSMSEVSNLMVQRIGETTLKPDTPVICINRGRKALEDTWDGNHLTIPPGHFRTEYAAALHFKRRLIVKGTRNPEVGGFVSWIGILGTDDQRVAVDSPNNCVPFTDEELQRFGEKIEAIDRDALSDPDAKFARPMALAGSRVVRSNNLRPQIDANAQASDAASANAEHVFDPPEDSLTREAEAEAAAERGTSQADDDDGPAPQPRPMRGGKAKRR